jgi:hypothetical protein
MPKDPRKFNLTKNREYSDKINIGFYAVCKYNTLIKHIIRSFYNVNIALDISL